MGCTTLIIAIYGAVLSSLALGWHIHTYFQDRPLIELKCFIANMMPSDGKRYLCYKIINKGKREASITNVGGELDNGKQFIFNTFGQIPTKIEPLNNTVIKIESPKITESITALWVTDGVGKNHKTTNEDLMKVITQIKEEGDNNGCSNKNN